MFVSKDGSVTKAHAKYLEKRLFEEAEKVDKCDLENGQRPGGAQISEADRGDMEAFLRRIRLLLPVLRSDILTPDPVPTDKVLFCRRKRAVARGQRTEDGFVVFRGSTAVLEQVPSAEKYPYAVAGRKQLLLNRTLKEKDGLLVFAKDYVISSPTAAAVVIYGGNAAGPTAWKNEKGTTLKQLDEEA